MYFQFKVILFLTIGSVIMLSGCSDDDDKSMSGNSGTSNPPVISRVTWTQDAGCAQGSQSDVVIAVTVNDPDTDPANLTYSGSVSGCSGTLDGQSSVVSCPQLAQYSGSVTVTDPQGNSDSVSFSFGPCANGEISP